MENRERRLQNDRREKSTPALSRYSLFGRRTGFRRQSDRLRGGYVDRYSSKVFFFLVLILGLNLADIILTLVALDHKGGKEFNPIVRSAMDLFGDHFWIWKVGLVSVCSVLLCLHSKIKRVEFLISALGCIYVLLIAYQMFFIHYR